MSFSPSFLDVIVLQHHKYFPFCSPLEAPSLLHSLQESPMRNPFASGLAPSQRMASWGVAIALGLTWAAWDRQKAAEQRQQEKLQQLTKEEQDEWNDNIRRRTTKVASGPAPRH